MSFWHFSGNHRAVDLPECWGWFCFWNFPRVLRKFLIWGDGKNLPVFWGMKNFFWALWFYSRVLVFFRLEFLLFSWKCPNDKPGLNKCFRERIFCWYFCIAYNIDVRSSLSRRLLAGNCQLGSRNYIFLLKKKLV